MSSPRVALTFDTEHWSHPSGADVQERILDVLAGAGVRATFFVQGRWATAYPECARRIAEERGADFATLAAQLARNARLLFRLPEPATR